ncbi:phage antirepressor KilAC domain-containing protein [Streptomyces sp. NPDC047971]|uniref:phage antirepressor KilAC domain-containing protein n=1 Tax=Streptomyces sp. NPDC047971 TaxID=3154499 RepID=UPI0033D98CAD
MHVDISGQERWSARDLQALMGYERWERFEDVITRAKETVEASGLDPLDHFRGAAKLIPGGRWGKQNVADYRLTRFGAYHVALAGDGRKAEVAAAKTYFAVKTREAEVAQTPHPDITSPEGILALAEQYVAAAKELVTTKKELAIAAPKAGKWDAFCDSDGLIEMGTAAHALHHVTGGLGRTKFMDLLRSPEVRFLQVQNTRIPYQEHTAAGRAEVKFVAAGYKMVEQTFLTPKGLDWLVDKIGRAAAAA